MITEEHHPLTNDGLPMKKCLIEYDLPLAAIPEASVKEKKIRYGYMVQLSAAVLDWKFAFEIGVTSADGISRATLENTILETIRQIGAEVVSEV